MLGVCLFLAVAIISGVQCTAVFLHPLSDVTVALGGHPITFRCVARADNLFWFVNDTWYPPDFRSMDLFLQGFEFSTISHNGDVVSGNITIDISEQHWTNNNTVVECHAHFVNNDTSVFSRATILLAGVPLPPSPVFSIINKLTIHVEWEEPFTWNNFPINAYLVEIVNHTSNTLLSRTSLNPNNNSYSISQMSPQHFCTTLLVRVSASNVVGSSSFGYIYGGFPSPPGSLSGSINSTVLLTTNGTPFFEINFTCPLLCPYNDATFSVNIINNEGYNIATYGPIYLPWTKSGSKLSYRGLTKDSIFNASITVMTVGGEYHHIFSFSTNTSHPIGTTSTPAITHPTGIGLKAGIIGGGAVFFLTGLIASVCVFKRKIKKGVEIHNARSSAPAANSYGIEPVIYEEIPVESCHNESLAGEREEGYTTITEQIKFSSKDNMKLQEEAYTVMKSAGSLSTRAV